MPMALERLTSPLVEVIYAPEGTCGYDTRHDREEPLSFCGRQPTTITLLNKVTGEVLELCKRHNTPTRRYSAATNGWEVL